MPLFRRREGRAGPAVADRAEPDDVRRRILAAAPSVGGAVVEQLRPAVRYAACRQPDAAMDIGVSKFGGAPDLPQGTRWPTWTAREGEPRPLQFFAQVNLAAAAEVAPEPLGFPLRGQLSFFADLAAEGDRAAVLFSSHDAQFVRYSPRMPPLPSGQLHPVGAWSWPSALPDGRANAKSEQQALDALRQTLEAELAAGVPERWSFVGRHQLGGHPRVPLGDPSAGYRLLLQLDSDETLEVSWGGGTLSWAARPDDIDAGRWDAAVFRLHCA